MRINNTAHHAVPALAAASLAAGLAACGASPNSPDPVAASSSVAAPAFTQAQGVAICHDFAAWLPVAFNQDEPRFSSQLQADESEAASTQLGSDLSTLDSDLQSINSDAFFPQQPGSPSDLQAIQNDCAAYGVTIKQPS